MQYKLIIRQWIGKQVAYQLNQIPLHNTRVSCEKIDYL